jgi:hypothetical protein
MRVFLLVRFKELFLNFTYIFSLIHNVLHQNSLDFISIVTVLISFIFSFDIIKIYKRRKTQAEKHTVIRIVIVKFYLETVSESIKNFINKRQNANFSTFWLWVLWVGSTRFTKLSNEMGEKMNDNEDAYDLRILCNRYVVFCQLKLKDGNSVRLEKDGEKVFISFSCWWLQHSVFFSKNKCDQVTF